jgi:hypothetical protein
MFVSIGDLVSDHLEPRDLYHMSLTCKTMFRATTDPIKKACLKRAFDKYTKRVESVQRGVFHAYTPHGNHHVSLNVFRFVIFVFHEPLKFDSFDRRMYRYEELSRPFMADGELSGIFFHAMMDQAFMATISGMWIRNVVVSGNGIRFVLVLSRAGLPDLTLPMNLA